MTASHWRTWCRGLWPFLERLPNGYETVLGPEFAGTEDPDDPEPVRGADLSVGQWQRVAIARAFYRGAPLVILDEPTAALDPRAERELFDTIRTAARRPYRAVYLAPNLQRAFRTASTSSTRVASSSPARTAYSWPRTDSTPSSSPGRRRRTSIAIRCNGGQRRRSVIDDHGSGQQMGLARYANLTSRS
jgi:hypothetical protein